MQSNKVLRHHISLASFVIILVIASTNCVLGQEEYRLLESHHDLVLSKTGSWANCTSSTHQDPNPRLDQTHHHPDSAFERISCRDIHYRLPKRKIQLLQNVHRSSSSSSHRSHSYSSNIIVGVLSSASNTGPTRRKSIRSTWAYRRTNVIFLVAGPWKDIQEEYHKNQDLLWMDIDELYDTENSTLTYKTYTFLNVMYHQIYQSQQHKEEEGQNNNHTDIHVSFLFKTDDDSYVDLETLQEVLLSSSSSTTNTTTNTTTITIDYWGKCNNWGKKPHRNQDIPWQKKWYMSYDIYPEEYYPPYCQGAGYAISTKFLSCAVGKYYTSKIRFMPHEDVAVGLLAQRCQIQPIHDERIVIRWNQEEEEPTMKNKIVQHYIITEKQMRQHHKSVTGVYGPQWID